MLKTRSNQSIIRIFFYSMLFISLVSTAIIGYLWITDEFRQFDRESENMKKEYIDSQKRLVQNEVQKVADYIEFRRSKIDAQLKESLRERVNEAYDIANYISRKFKTQKSENEIRQLIKETFRPIRFHRGRSYYYIYSLAGVVELWPPKPGTEGEHQLDLLDNQGVYVVRKEIELIRKQGEGFLVNTWKDPRRNPHNPDMVYSKVSFIKYFEPFNWYFGAKEYREDFLKDIQHEILERIGKIKFGKDGYIFVVDFDGVTLWNDIRPDLIGKKVWADDPGGEEIIARARDAAQKPGGDFIEYTWFKPGQNVPIHKTSFVQGINDWQWIIGAGVYLDEIDQVIAEKKEQLKTYAMGRVFKIIIIFLVIAAVVIIITLLFSRRLRKEIDVFLTFFRNAAMGNEEIDTEKLSAEEFKSLADSANRMLAARKEMENELEKSQKLESLGLLAGGIAHDFNNLLTGVLGNISLVNRPGKTSTSSTSPTSPTSPSSPDDVRERLEQAEKAALKAQQLTQQLLTFARGGEPIKKVHTVSNIIKEAVSFASHGSNVKCDVKLAPGLLPVEADEGQLKQVFYNLVINAVQAMPAGGTVDIAAANVSPGSLREAFPPDAGTGLLLPEKKYIRITIKDTGQGIPDHLQKKIFDPYFSTKPKASGLGLTAAYSIIKNHGGLIDVKSEPAKGATFTVYLPSCGKEIPQTEPGDENKKNMTEQIKANSDKTNILVMDDDPFVGDVAVNMLSHLGYQPLLTLDGRGAIDAYKKAMEQNRPFQAVIMDLTIPGGMGGAEAVKELLEIDPKVKAIVSSGYSTDPVMANFQQYGFLACIKKPYRLHELSQVLDMVIGH